MGTVTAAVCAALAVRLWLAGGSLARLRAAPPGPVGWSLPARLRLPTRREATRLRALVTDLPLVCDLLAVCVESGRPTRAALRVVADVCEEPTRGLLLGVWKQIDLGVGEAEAWASLSRQPGYRGVARDLARTVGTGVRLGALLRQRAAEARAAGEVEARSRARKVAVAGVLPLVVCYLPAFLLVGVVPIFGGLFAKLLG